MVFIQYYDQEILGRNPQGGGIENEDSVEITLRATNDLNVVAYGNGASSFTTIPGNWCNIATVTDGPLNRGADSDSANQATGSSDGFNDVAALAVPLSLDADTLCHRVIEAFLDVRKTAFDAVAPAGSVDSFRVEIANLGSATLTNVTIVDSMDVNFPSGLRARQRLTAADIHLNTTNFPGATVSAVDTTSNPAFDIFTVTLPTVTPSTAAQIAANGGFREAYRVVVRLLANSGTFCNRVTARATTAGGQTFTETDIACITVLPGAVEFDITNEDGTTPTPPPAGFNSNKEIFRVGDGGAARPDSLIYQVIVRNRSQTFTATNVVIRDSVSPNLNIIACRATVLAIVPLATLLSHATESVAAKTGDTVGGLLNATLGNLTELVIALAALRDEPGLRKLLEGLPVARGRGDVALGVELVGRVDDRLVLQAAVAREEVAPAFLVHLLEALVIP